MRLVVSSDTTALSYLLNWRVILCAAWVLIPIAISSLAIRKYERLDQLKSDTGESQQDIAWISQEDKAWRICLKEIHPIWLLAYRVIAFCLLLGTIVVKVVVNGGLIFFYYTQWTVTLLTVYFAMNAGAVMLTDSVYWFIIFPFLTTRDYNLSFMSVNMHTLNAVLLLGDTALNCLRVPLFRISFFVLWTGAFFLFQWIFHIFVSIRWPYPFLDLSSPYAPLWYLLMALMHVPCYGIFALIVHIKLYLLSKWFPLSYQF